MNKKLIWGIVIAVVIIAVGSYAYIYFSQPSYIYDENHKWDADISNWNTYTNEKYGFEFKYPANFVIGDGSDSTSSNDVVLLATEFDATGQPVMDNRVFVLKNYSWKGSNKTSSEIISDLHLGELLLPDGKDSNGNIYKVVSNGVDSVVLQFNPIAAENQVFMQSFISGFKFTESTSDWKTYTNDQYAYQIDYPSEQTLEKLKVRPEIQVGNQNQLVACESEKKMSGVRLISINKTDFYFDPLQANGGEFVTVYTTVRNNLCYQILFHIGNRSSTSDSVETKQAVDLVSQIINTFKFTK